MDLTTFDALHEVLAGHTSDSEHCLFGLCTILGWEDSFSAHELELPYLKLLEGRCYIVLAGSLFAVKEIAYDWSKRTASRTRFTFSTGEGSSLGAAPSEMQCRETPTLVWPTDQSWFVASEVDFDSTLVGGSASLIEAIVASPKLEAWQVEATDSLAADADKINVG